MLNRRTVLVAALGVTLGALPAGTTQAQTASGRLGGRPALEGFYTQLRLDGDGPALNANGVGARLMWSPAAMPGALASLAGRTELGLYATYTPERSYARGLTFSTASLGAVADVRPFGAPLAGRVDPFVSLGAGALNSRVDVAVAPSPSPLLAGSSLAFTLSPGIGTRVLLTPNVALQGDVRDLMTFRGDTRHNVGLGAGLRLTF
jgi:hypothetical protein